MNNVIIHIWRLCELLPYAYIKYQSMYILNPSIGWMDGNPA